MVTLEVQEAAWILLLYSKTIEREERIVTRFPRKKRTLRVPVSSFSSFPSPSSFVRESLGTKTYRPKADTLDVSSNPIRNSKRCPPSRQQQRLKKAKRKDNGRFEAGTSSRKPTPEWLVQLMKAKNGENPKHIIDKGLTATDVDLAKHRLSMPYSQIIDVDFLSPVEERKLKEDANRARKVGVEAILVTSDLKDHNLKLKRWDMVSSPIYNLTTGWKDLVTFYRLKKDDNISIWSFHANDKLYFAVAPPPPPPPPPQTTDSGQSSSACVGDHQEQT